MSAADLPNAATGHGSFVGGGRNNAATGMRSFVGGGNSNTAGDYEAFVGGGHTNTAAGSFSFVGGGSDNTASGTNAFVGGGNTNTASEHRSFVGGGTDNTANGLEAFVAAGQSNTASGARSFVGGGSGNTAGGAQSFVAGGSGNIASGIAAFAAGQRAKAEHDGAFVWADRTSADFASTAGNQFLIRAGGGVGIGTDNPRSDLHVRQRSADDSAAGIAIESASSAKWALYVDGADELAFRFDDAVKARINPSDGAYLQLSDAERKTSVEPLEDVLDKLLQLQPSTYRLADGPAGDRRSIGLIAQDVKARFPEAVFGAAGDYAINYGQIAVLNTAALIELNADYERRLAAQAEEIAALSERNARIEARLDRLERLLERKDPAAREAIPIEP